MSTGCFYKTVIFTTLLWVNLTGLSAGDQLKTGFYAGRVPPSRFEYPVKNGWMYPKEGKKICENDPACAGFTFKGTVLERSEASSLPCGNMLAETRLNICNNVVKVGLLKRASW